VNATASRAEVNQYGSIRLAVMICPFGPGCSSTFMPQNTPIASPLSATGGGGADCESS